MKEVGLTFPLINPERSSWLTSTMLYWDDVATIVPSEWERSPDGPHQVIGEDTRELINAGLLEPVTPEADVLGTKFDEWIDDLDRLAVARRRHALAEGRVLRIHRSKWTAYSSGLDSLLRTGLARNSEGGVWLEVEGQTGYEFMASLALDLCAHRSGTEAEESRWRPVTEDARAYEALTAVPHPNRITGGNQLRFPLAPDRIREDRRVAWARQTILDDILPFPEGGVDARKILDFKEKHGNMLPNLRREMTRRCTEIAAADEAELRNHLLDLAVEDLREQSEEASRYLNESSFLRIARTAFVCILKLVPTVGPLADLLEETPQARDTRDRMKADPLAYLSLLRQEFLTGEMVRPESDPRVSADRSSVTDVDQNAFVHQLLAGGEAGSNYWS